MQFFIDTADISAIKKANDMGLVDGVTTNPTLIKKAGRDHEATIREISELISGPVSVETISEDAAGMLKEASELAKIHKNVVIIGAGGIGCELLKNVVLTGFADIEVRGIRLARSGKLALYLRL